MTNATEKGSQETHHNDKLSVYDFSFDPEEERQPLSAISPKRKVTKKKPKPKLVILKDSYNRNLSKALANLKHIINKNNKNEHRLIPADSDDKVRLSREDVNKNNLKQTIGTMNIAINQVKLDNGDQNKPPDPQEVGKLQLKALNPSHNENLIRLTVANNTSEQPNELLQQQSPICNPQSESEQNYEDLSFDEQPTASSSFLCSPRRPNATPWRLHWEMPAAKWPVNMYVKSNMTPAYESNFSNVDVDNGSRTYPVDIEINTHHCNDTTKNICEESNNLVQTSILSFVQEVATKNTQKKNKLSTHAKHNSSFQTDVSFGNSASNTLHYDHFFTPEKTEPGVKKPDKLYDKSHATKIEKVKKCVFESNESSLKALRKDDEKINQVPVKKNMLESPEDTPQKRKRKNQAKTPNKRKKSDSNFVVDFDGDQENQSPTKEPAKPHFLRPRTAGVLKEVNSYTRPPRTLDVYTKDQEEIPKCDLLVKNSSTDKDSKTLSSNINPSNNLGKSITLDGELPKKDQINDGVDNMSPVLFDDVDIVHHNKLVRKSYGKGVKTSKSKVSTATSVPDSSLELDSDEELGFVQPVLREENPKAKKKKVHKISRKEAEEADQWASSFNSMCEDIEEFELIIE